MPDTLTTPTHWIEGRRASERRYGTHAPHAAHYCSAHPMNQSDHYAIRIGGHLGPEWTDWLGGLHVTNHDSGEAELTGRLLDQAALYGVLLTVRDLGLPLLSVTRLPTPSAPGGDEPCGCSP